MPCRAASGQTTGVSPLEAIAALFGIVNIVLIARRTVWNYPFGVVMVCMYAIVFWQQQLFATAALQIFFLGSQLYGWWYWRQAGTGAAPVPVRALSGNGRVWALGGGVIGTLALGFGLARISPDAAPWPDAANLAWSMVAQILTDRRHVESWPLWVAIDAGSIWLYASQGLVATAALYGVFLVIALWGWAEWRRAALVHP